MPSKLASELTNDDVLVDPSGKLYRVLATHQADDGRWYVWLWVDGYVAQPNFFQVFGSDEEINFIKHEPATTPVDPDDDTAVINIDAPIPSEGDATNG